jgi:hypothetical protein
MSTSCATGAITQTGMGFYRKIVETIAARKAAALEEYQTWGLIEKTVLELKKKAEGQEQPARRWERFIAWAKGAGRTYAQYAENAKVQKISVRQIELELSEVCELVLSAHKAQLRKDWREQDGGNQLFKFLINKLAAEELVEALEEKYGKAENQ